MSTVRHHSSTTPQVAKDSRPNLEDLHQLRLTSRQIGKVFHKAQKDRRLSPADLKVLAIIHRLAGTTGFLFVPLTRLAEEMGHQDTGNVSRQVRKLVQLGYLRRVNRGNGRGHRSTYILADPDDKDCPQYNLSTVHSTTFTGKTTYIRDSYNTSYEEPPKSPLKGDGMDSGKIDEEEAKLQGVLVLRPEARNGNGATLPGRTQPPLEPDRLVLDHRHVLKPTRDGRGQTCIAMGCDYWEGRGSNANRV